jgi:hypothetical protein
VPAISEEVNAVQVLEVRNAELIRSLTEQAAHVIPSEHPIALAAGEQVVVKEFPDDGPPGRGRINDTRAAFP